VNSNAICLLLLVIFDQTDRLRLIMVICLWTNFLIDIEPIVVTSNEITGSIIIIP